MLPFLLLASAVAAQAPAATAPPAAPAAPAFASHHGGRMFISPMGEPFRPENREQSGLAEWFRQADRNHDGQLTLDEMQADAERFFGLLDVNHDGEIDPDEITRYETVVAPEISSGGGSILAMAGMEGSGGGGGRHRGGHGGGRSYFRGSSSDQHQGAGRFGLLDLPEPVTAADSNFNRGVSREEFRAAAGQRFLALDLDHHGYLTLAGLEAIRPAPPPQSNREYNPDRDAQPDPEAAIPDSN